LETKKQINTEEEKDYIYGFGGWLILIAIGFTISFGRSLFYLFDELIPLFSDGTIQEAINVDPMWGLLFFIEFVFHIGIVIFVGFIGYLCIKQMVLFKKKVIYFLIFNFIMTIISFLSYLTVPEMAVDATDTMVTVFQSAIYAAIWIPYIIKSKRVNNTFVL
jgi:hypothetical protein